MEPTRVFSTKAEKYARYRWDYSPSAIQTLFEAVHLSAQSVVADIGAGTGILTKQFCGRVKQVYAVEPNLEMRQIAEKYLAGCANCRVIDGKAEATQLADSSVDLITVATAIHWFTPEPTRAEFRRVLKPGGWLANLHNYGTNQEMNAASRSIYPAETDTKPMMKGGGVPFCYYLGHEEFQTLTFAFTRFETWEVYFGALNSASFAPDESSPLYAEFERAARQVFDRFAVDGLVQVDGVTELTFGQLI